MSEITSVNIDNRLTFHKHINEICEKAGHKLNVLSRIIPFKDFPKKKTNKCFFHVTIQLLSTSMDVT